MGEEHLELPSKDSSNLSYFLTISILILSVIIYLLFYQIGDEFQSDRVNGKGGIFTLILTLFRLGCAYLVLHTVTFWMVKNPVPGVMTPLFRVDSISRPYRSKGFERLVPFSSWTMLIFGFAMLWNGISSAWVFFATPPEFVLHFGTAIYATAFSSAVLTATIVRYVILPAQMKRGEDIYHMFLPHEQVMHNWALILLSCELVLGTMSIRIPMIVLGLTYGAIYLIFAELWARFGGGYYVYEFIDPRPKEGPFLLVGLMVVCLLSFFVGLFISYVKESSTVLALGLVIILISLSTRFGTPTEYVPTLARVD